MGALDDLFNNYKKRPNYTPNSSLDEAFRRLNEELNRSQSQYYQQYNRQKATLNDALGQLGGLGGIKGAGAAYKPRIKDPATRIVEIDRELDIIRGVIPTPKGYSTDVHKVKTLLAERAELKKHLT